MKLDVPSGSTYHWNPYSPKFYTLVSPPLSSAGVSSDDESFEDRSVNTLEDDEYDLGWASIASVRRETTDNSIHTAILRLPRRTLLSMMAVIENSPSLFLELCEKERGNVVSHVMMALGADECHEVCNLAVDHCERLAKGQSGCIALTRIFDAASEMQQAAMRSITLGFFPELVMHQYGNFVLSRMLQGADREFYEAISVFFSQAENLDACVHDKFGSHVYEAFVKNAPKEALFDVCAVLLRDSENILRVATSKFSNYPLQATLRQMLFLEGEHPLSQWAVETIPAIVKDTTFAPNINRSLGFRPTDDRKGNSHPRSPKHHRH